MLKKIMFDIKKTKKSLWNENSPASIAFLAAILKSLTIWGISSVLSRRGGVECAPSYALMVKGLSVEEIRACPFSWKSVDKQYENLRKHSILSIYNKIVKRQTLIWNPPHMPKLTKEDSTFGMNSIHDGFPCFNLLFCPYARCIRIPLQHQRNLTVIKSSRQDRLKFIWACVSFMLFYNFKKTC